MIATTLQIIGALSVGYFTVKACQYVRMLVHIRADSIRIRREMKRRMG